MLFLVDYINPPRVKETRKYSGDDLEVFFKYVIDALDETGCKVARVHHRETGADMWKLVGVYNRSDLEGLL